MIVFDVDGTILPGTSCERLFVRYLIKQRVLWPWSLIPFYLRAISLLRYGLPYATKANKGYLRGFSYEQMADIGREFFAQRVASRLSAKARGQIEKHRISGERIILLSGMPDFLLDNFARTLGIKDRYGSVMEIRDGKFTGRTLGPFPLGMGKVMALERIMAGNYTPSPGDYELRPNTYGPDDTIVTFPGVTFYGDHWLDRYLFERVGRPVVVNGDSRLVSLAQKRGWAIERFE